MKWLKGDEGSDVNARRIVLTGAPVSLVVASLLTGIALIVASLRDVHLRVELTRTSDDPEEAHKVVDAPNYSFRS